MTKCLDDEENPAISSKKQRKKQLKQLINNVTILFTYRGWTLNFEVGIGRNNLVKQRGSSGLMAAIYRKVFKKPFDFRNLVQAFAAIRINTSKLHSCRHIAASLGKDLNIYSDHSSSVKSRQLDFGTSTDNIGNDHFDRHVNLSNVHLTEEELAEYPIQQFTGNIYIVKEPSNENELEILSALNRLKEEKVLGLDVEMTEGNRLDDGRKKKKTRVVQIASETDAIVWQLKSFTLDLPSSLVCFLKSDILKVGHAISDDVVLLKQEFNIRSRCLFDTLPWAMELNCKPLGLHALCAIFLGWRISKGLRTSNWNRSDLSVNQIHYACTDAWASLMLYKKMKRVACENGNVVPLPIASVTDILVTRLISRRKRRSRLVQNNKARKNFNTIAETAMKVVE